MDSLLCAVGRDYPMQLCTTGSFAEGHGSSHSIFLQQLSQYFLREGSQALRSPEEQLIHLLMSYLGISCEPVHIRQSNTQEERSMGVNIGDL